MLDPRLRNEIGYSRALVRNVVTDGVCICDLFECFPNTDTMPHPHKSVGKASHLHKVRLTTAGLNAKTLTHGMTYIKVTTVQM